MKDKDQVVKPPPKSISLKKEEECGKSYQEQIKPYVQLDESERAKGSPYEKVEIFWPHTLLQVCYFNPAQYFQIYLKIIYLSYFPTVLYDLDILGNLCVKIKFSARAAVRAIIGV